MAGGSGMKKRISFTVDDTKLFDRLSEPVNQQLLGTRLVSAFLADPSLIEAIGLAFYGITDYEASEIGEETRTDEDDRRCVSCANDIQSPNQDRLCDLCLQIEEDRAADEAASSALEGEG